MSIRNVCPACGGTKLDDLYHLTAIPVQSCVLLDDEAEARAFPLHDISIRFCQDCGFAFNAVFKPELVDYAAATEESQHFSGTFNAFANRIVEDIAQSYELSEQKVLEVGCGKGDFLLALCQATGAVGLGVDPGYLPNREEQQKEDRISFRREYFDPDQIKTPPDYIICRHTLEHIADVDEFIGDVVKAAPRDRNVEVFFETPDFQRVMAEGAFWDIYYEHCSYFSLGSHARLLRRHGVDVHRSFLDYGEQYIMQYGTLRDDRHAPDRDSDLDEMRGLAAAFPGKVAGVLNHWRSFVQDRKAAGRKVAIWGGGSKCVSFITSNGLDQEIDAVIDINPFKQGKYLPKSAHLVSAPSVLADNPPDTVIAMNPIYMDEIAAELARQGCGGAELVAV